MQSRNAIGNLIARYKSVLHHCNILNTRSIKKVASAIVSTCFILGLGGVGNAWGEDLVVGDWTNATTVKKDNYTNEKGSVAITEHGTLIIENTFTNNGNNATVNQWGDPLWGSQNVTVYSNGLLDVDILDNINGLFIIQGNLTATTINNSTSITTETTPTSGSDEAYDSKYDATGSYIYVDGGIVGDKNITTVNNNGHFLIGGGEVYAKEWNNTGTSTLKINSGTLEIAELNNEGSSQIYIYGGSVSVDTVKNNASITIANSGSTFTSSTITNGTSQNSGASFTIDNNAVLKATNFGNYANLYINSGSIATINTLTTYYGSSISINANQDTSNSVDLTSTPTLTVSTAFTNNGDFDITTGGYAVFENGFTNNYVLNVHTINDDSSDINGAVASTVVYVYGDFTNNYYGAASGDTIDDYTVHVASGGLLYVTGNFYNDEGIVQIDNATSALYVDGNFTNGTSTTTSTVSVNEDAQLIVGNNSDNIISNFTNTNGFIGLHGGDMTVEGTLTNDTADWHPTDESHLDEEETIHVHDGTLTATTFQNNAGSLGIYEDGTAKFVTVNSVSGTAINIYGGGTLEVQNGLIEDTFTIGNDYETVEDGKLLKTGSATDTLTITNILVNEGLINITNGGLIVKDLIYAGDVASDSGSLNKGTYDTYSSNFVSEGAVVVSGSSSYLQLGELSTAGLHSLLNTGYATTEGDHHGDDTEFTVQQASVLFNEGVGIVLVGDHAQLILTNDTTTTSTNTVDFGGNTLFKFNGHGFDRENAAITIVGGDDENTAGDIYISSSSAFLATNLVHDTYYTIVENVANYSQEKLDSTGWYTSIAAGSLDRMLEDAELLYVPSTNDAYGDSDTDDIVLVSGAVTDKNFGVDDEIFESMKDLWEEGENDKESDNAGTGFLSDAADKTEIPDDKEAGKTIESATNVAITGGVVQLTTDASDIMSQAVNLRIDGLHADSGGYAEDISATDWGLWAIPLYQQSQVRNIKIGVTSGGYDGWLAGVVAGIDRKKDEWTLGVALGIGIGEMESTDDFVNTNTDMDFWSAIAYAGYHKNRFEWKADFTYTNASSEIRQENPYHLVSMSDIRADVDGQLFSLGTQVSYKIIDDDVDVTPHIGFRYRAYRQDSFNSTIDGRGLFHVENADMDTYLLPVGVLISTDFLYNQWLITPRLDLVYTAFFGDTAINNYVGLTGSGADVDAFGTAKMQSDVLDDYMLSLSIGCGAKKDKWSLGLDFDFQRSENREAQAVFARIAYRFQGGC